MYRIAINSARQLVEVTMAGMLSVAETDAYIAELRSAFATGRLKPGYRLLLDVDACKIQSQEMTGAMGAHMAAMPKASAIAVVTGSSLARMQIRRLFAQPYARIVSTREEARAWVLDGTEPAQPGRP